MGWHCCRYFKFDHWLPHCFVNGGEINLMVDRSHLLCSSLISTMKCFCGYMCLKLGLS
jgi:hypothetical protein